MDDSKNKQNQLDEVARAAASIAANDDDDEEAFTHGNLTMVVINMNIDNIEKLTKDHKIVQGKTIVNYFRLAYEHGQWLTVVKMQHSVGII